MGGSGLAKPPQSKAGSPGGGSPLAGQRKRNKRFGTFVLRASGNKKGLSHPPFPPSAVSQADSPSPVFSSSWPSMSSASVLATGL